MIKRLDFTSVGFSKNNITYLTLRILLWISPVRCRFEYTPHISIPRAQQCCKFKGSLKKVHVCVPCRCGKMSKIKITYSTTF